MIKNFKHKGLERFFRHDEHRHLDKQQLPRITRILDLLDVIEDVRGMDLPGYGLHQLIGNRRGTWSVKVSGNWRITFRFEKSNALDVNLEDYH